MDWQRTGILIQVITVVGSFIVFMSSGSFTVGTQITVLTAKVDLLKQEVVSNNQMLGYRIDRLEKQNELLNNK